MDSAHRLRSAAVFASGRRGRKEQRARQSAEWREAIKLDPSKNAIPLANHGKPWDAKPEASPSNNPPQPRAASRVGEPLMRFGPPEARSADCGSARRAHPRRGVRTERWKVALRRHARSAANRQSNRNVGHAKPEANRRRSVRSRRSGEAPAEHPAEPVRRRRRSRRYGLRRRMLVRLPDPLHPNNPAKKGRIA